MSNFKLLQGYLKLQRTIMFDKLTHLDYAIIGFCQDDKSIYWNYALVNKLISLEQLEKIEQILKSLKRNPALYFENRHQLKGLITFLKRNNYKLGYEDSWMFYNGRNIDKSRFNSVKKVNNQSDLKIFLKTFDSCYQKNDPQNVYGELGEYLIVAEKSWHKHHRSNRIEYFIIYNGKEPVAVSTLTNHKQIGYISNVGSLRKTRGKGFGKLASLYCVALSKKRGNSYHCLATEENTFANEFYKRIGFKTLFTAICYFKK